MQIVNFACVLRYIYLYVMISVDKSLAKNYSPKNFTAGLRTTSKMASDGCSVFNHIFPHYAEKLCSLKIIIVLQKHEISLKLIAALGFKWNPLWHRISILDNTLSVHIRRAISHSHITYAKTVPSWFLLNLKVVQVT